MIVKQDGVKCNFLPDNAYCSADEKKRHPFDIYECPIGYEECVKGCKYYEEVGNEYDNRIDQEFKGLCRN